jgi:membrane associated rhomboid family serine protease
MTPAPVGLRCPEHSGQPQGIQRVTRPAQQAVRGSALSRPNIVTLTLIAVNVGVYLLELAIGGSTDGTNNWIYEHGALVMNAVYGDGTPAGVANGEWWRMVSAAFLHFGPIHLLLNMYSLYYAGRCWSR